VIHSREFPQAEFRPINLRRMIQPFVGRWPALLAATLLPVLVVWTASAAELPGDGADPARAGPGPARAGSPT
jgi:hypothetical protein